MAASRQLHMRLVRFGVTALIIVALSALLLEVGARFLAGALGLSPYMRYDATLGWTAIEYASKKHRDRGGQFDVVYEINENGYRGTAYPVARNNGSFRILVLGDSTGFGWGVPWDHTFAGILDRELENTEVIDLALSGFGLDQSYLRFVKEGVAYKPDLVIIQSTPNDFEEIMYSFFNQKPKPHFVRTQRGDLSLSNVPVESRGDEAERFHAMSIPVPFKEWLGWNSYAFNVINEYYHGIRRTEPHKLPEGEQKVNDDSVWMYNAILRKLEEQIEQNGAKGLLVHTIRQVSGTSKVTAGHLLELDLHPTFLEKGNGDVASYFYSDGYHWNSKGHRIVADELMRSIGALRTETVNGVAVEQVVDSGNSGKSDE